MMFRVRLIVLLCVAFLWTLATPSWAAGAAKYFLLVVWDGMRPDFVTQELTPTLWSLREGGVWFANHRSAYPTSTEVNGTVLATGMFPQRSGITANKEYRETIDPLAQFGTQSLKAVRRGDELSGGKYVRVPTVAELVQAAGGKTAVVGAKPVALLHDRLPRSAGSQNPVWFVNGSLPEMLASDLTNKLGDFPAPTSPNVARDVWATRCLTEMFWRDVMPRYSVLWLSEPDYSQHKNGVDSPQALAAIRSCDQRLASVLAELDRRGIRNETDIAVVSDHGFSTIGQNGDVAATLRAAGINARSSWDHPPKTDDVVVVGNGGSVLVYVTGRSPKSIERVVATLQRNPSSGVLFTRAGIEGTFALAEAKLDSPTAPDVIVASGWKISSAPDGRKISDITNDGYSEYHAGSGMHVTLSPTDLHNTAIFSGPDFKHGVTSPMPSGNVDIVPTFLWLMGITPPEPLDGRVLSEALLAEGPPLRGIELKHIQARKELADGIWQQHLKFTEVNGVRYLDEGNGTWTPATSDRTIQSSPKETK